MPSLVPLSLGFLVFSKFHPGEKSLEGAFRNGCAGMFSPALPLRLVEQDVCPAHQTVLERRIKHPAALLFFGEQSNRIRRPLPRRQEQLEPFRATRVDGCQMDVKWLSERHNSFVRLST
jgi:hypothetical protein